MAANGLGYPISIEGAAKYWREDILVQRRISPEITTKMCIRDRNCQGSAVAGFVPPEGAAAGCIPSDENREQCRRQYLQRQMPE